MMAPDETVPDLLRRFVPTPHQLNLVLMGVPLFLQTNDLVLLEQMQGVSHASASADDPAVLLKIIRDYDVVTDTLETTLLSAGPLVTIIAGRHSIIVLDCERREVLGFLSASVDAGMFINELLPLLLARISSGVP
jgi:hypothetical protein